MRLSIAIPLYNEQDVLPELLQRVTATLDSTPGGPHEVLFVDDGSTDGTLELLRAVAGQDPRIVVLSFSRNFGHQAAFAAGLDHASGDLVVLMDGDLQDRPEEIPRMIAEHEKGYDVVYAQRVHRKEGFLLRAAYRVFYRLVAFLADLQLAQDAGDFSLMSRRVVEAIKASPERHRYIRGLRAWAGFSQTGIQVERAGREHGVSKYTPIKLFRLACDGIFSFSVLPLRLATLVGTVSIGIAIVAALYAIVVKFWGWSTPQGFTALFVAIAFFAGVQLVFLGVCGEYIGRIYQEVKQRQLYILREAVNLKDAWKANTRSATRSSTAGIGGGAHESG